MACEFFAAELARQTRRRVDWDPPVESHILLCIVVCPWSFMLKRLVVKHCKLHLIVRLVKLSRERPVNHYLIAASPPWHSKTHIVLHCSAILCRIITDRDYWIDICFNSGSGASHQQRGDWRAPDPRHLHLPTLLRSARRFQLRNDFASSRRKLRERAPVLRGRATSIPALQRQRSNVLQLSAHDCKPRSQ